LFEQIQKLKLAVYLDEAGDDIVSACAALKDLDIHYAVLRNAWVGHISDVDDRVYQQIRSELIRNNISIVAIISDIGKVPVNQLATIDNAKITRIFNIASYFGVSHIRFHIGTQSTENVGAIYKWMQLITDKCLETNIVPLLEITGESSIISPIEIAPLLSKFKRWKLLYDPVQLILRQNQDPFVRYWALLKSFVGAIDIRDYKIGYGFKPVDFGDAKIGLTLRDAINSHFDGWYYLEPSLGRKHGNATSKRDTLRMALEALEKTLQ